ncbi:hypothetical protein A2856_01835 [Candidatus Uhrbacteria bacterium RIFCSPHIGHO2_01_FULL_63_20]|uniref:Guanylate cyclase domain-containing protein n=1 Tax=Candidatus Uhrbacteria bacterium RIFCSPHIGHO2_01_FULL_63_20 TaxID=1802385 RepID=A0A1F7TKC8_9BACT|nr:MAG: hypothetical protein A2856_01835 [Candidatus Uhrbacteria bacterium RIFCSPHIGHO2_01_FULL_63_20]
MSKQGVRRLAFWAAASAAAFALLWLAARGGALEQAHLSISNLLFQGREGRAAPFIVLVAIDDASLARRSMGEQGTLRFGKAEYARVVDALADAGAAAVGVDVILSEASAEADVRALVDALARHPNVVLAAMPGVMGAGALLPLPAIASAAEDRLGSVLFRPDADNTVRRVIALTGDMAVPEAFSVAVLRAALGASERAQATVPGPYEITSRSVRLGRVRVPSVRLPLDERGRFVSDFFGPPGSYRTISFADALDGRLVDRAGQSVDLTGAIVLVGEMGTAIHDEQYVPSSAGARMSGVEIHANAIQTMLEGSYPREASPAAHAAMAAAVFALALAAFLLLAPRPAAALLAAAFALFTASVWIAIERGVVLHTVFPPLALVGAFVCAFSFRYADEARLSARIRRLFGMYVSPHVVQELVERPELVVRGGRKRTVTVLFSDIAGFTSIAERTDASELVEQLNEYLDAMSAVVYRHDGTVDKYIGDAVMAFWNAPLPQEDHAARACLTALDSLAALDDLNARRARRGQDPLHARFGINTGEMVVGNVGAVNRFDYTVIGDAVNLGARLEGANKAYGTRILVSEATYLAAKGAVEGREVDLLAVKGKAKSVRVYEVMGRAGALSERAQKVKAFFSEALASYRARDWDEAEALLRKALSIAPDDGVSACYLERVRVLRVDPPASDWDGSFHAKEK